MTPGAQERLMSILSKQRQFVSTLDNDLMLFTLTYRKVYLR